MASLSICAAVASALAASCKIIARMDAISKITPVEQPKVPGVATECLIMVRTLSQIQSAIISDLDGLETSLLALEDLESAVNASLSGCCLVLTAVEEEISALVTTSDSKEGITWTAREDCVWEEPKKRLFAYHLRSQNASITFLHILLKMDLLEDKRQFLLENNETFVTILGRAKACVSSKGKGSFDSEISIFDSKSSVFCNHTHLLASAPNDIACGSFGAGEGRANNSKQPLRKGPARRSAPTASKVTEIVPEPVQSKHVERSSSSSHNESFLSHIGKKATAAQGTVHLGAELHNATTRIEKFRHDMHKSIMDALEDLSGPHVDTKGSPNRAPGSQDGQHQRNSGFEVILNNLDSQLKDLELHKILEPFNRLSSMLLLRSHGTQALDLSPRMPVAQDNPKNMPIMPIIPPNSIIDISSTSVPLSRASLSLGKHSRESVVPALDEKPAKRGRTQLKLVVSDKGIEKV